MLKFHYQKWKVHATGMQYDVLLLDVLVLYVSIWLLLRVCCPLVLLHGHPFCCPPVQWLRSFHSSEAPAAQALHGFPHTAPASSAPSSLCWCPDFWRLLPQRRSRQCRARAARCRRLPNQMHSWPSRVLRFSLLMCRRRSRRCRALAARRRRHRWHPPPWTSSAAWPPTWTPRYTLRQILNGSWTCCSFVHLCRQLCSYRIQCRKC